MYCSKCGAENPRDSKFCGNCGQSFKVEFTSRTETNSHLDYQKENIKIQLESLKTEDKGTGVVSYNLNKFILLK